MRKIGALIAIITGIFSIVAGGLALGNIGDWGDQLHYIKGIGRQTYDIIIIVYGIILALLGLGTWSKARGFSSLLLLIAFTAGTVMLALQGWANGYELAALIIHAIGSGTVLIGMFIDKKN